MTIGNHDDTTATKGIVAFVVTGMVATLTVLALVLGVSAWSLSAQQGPALPAGLSSAASSRATTAQKPASG